MRLVALCEFSTQRSRVAGSAVEKAVVVPRYPGCSLLWNIPLRLVAELIGSVPMVAATGFEFASSATRVTPLTES
jgi:hypothetical protein